MKPQGRKKTKTRAAGHQECGTCHPEVKGGKAKEKVEVKKDIVQEVCQSCGSLEAFAAIDPYLQEIYGDVVEVYVCGKCYHEMVEAI